MTTKTAIATSDDFDFKRAYPEYFESEEVDVDRQITKEQRRTLENLIFSKISDLGERERRLTQIESYNYYDCAEAIGELLFAPFQ